MSENTMPSSPISSYSSLSQPTFSSDEEIKNASPRLSIITGIAMIAIALAVCGVLGLIAKFSTQATGLGAFSRLPLWVSSGIAFSGGAGVIALMTWAICQCKENQNQKIFDDEEHSPSAEEPLYTVAISDYRTLPPEFGAVLTKVKERLQISDIDAHLHALYGEHQPTLPVQRNNDRQLHSFEKYLELCLLTSEQLLSLPIVRIENLDMNGIHCLRDRLSSIEEVTTESSSENNERTLTLGQLRQLSKKDLLTYLDQNTFESILTLITSAQFKEILASGLLNNSHDVLDLSKVLSSLSSEREKMLLQSLSMECLCRHIETLSGNQLRLLADVQFKNPAFPWNAIEKYKLKEELFSLSEGSYNESKRILQLLDNDVIIILAPVLSGSHLRMLSDAQFQNPAFPWNTIAHDFDKSFDFFMRGYNSDPNWDRTTQHILQLLGNDAIAILAPALFHSNFYLFSDAQFTSPAFPWKAIALVYKDNHFFASQTHEEYEKTKRVLQLLGNDAIAILTPVLSGNELRKFSDAQFQNPAFPWDIIISDRNKVESLFSTYAFLSNSDKNESQRILQLLGKEAILKLAPVLSPSQRELLTEEQHQWLN